MNIHGYEIEKSNVSFKQELPLILKFEKKGTKKEVFPVTYFMDNQTGKYSLIESELTDTRHRGINSDTEWYDYKIDIQYDEVSKCLVFFNLELNLSNIDLGKPVFYKETDRFYVTPNKNIIYYDKSNRKAKFEDKWVFIERLERISDLPFLGAYERELLNGCDESSNKKYIKEKMGKIFNKIVNVAGNKAICLNTIDNIIEFLMYKEPTGRKGPLQNKIDEYCSLEYPPFIPERKVDYDRTTFSTEGRILRLKDDLLCLEMFNVDVNRKDCYEAYRMFINKNGEITTCKKNNFNKFVPTNTSLGGSHWKFIIREFDEKVVEGTKLEYYKNIIHDIPEKDRGYAIWCFINYPIFEKLYKAGLNLYLNKFFANNSDFPFENLLFGFGSNKTDDMGKNIYSILGVNKYQLEKLNEFYTTPLGIKYNYIVNPIGYVKEVLLGSGENRDISPIDNDTFDAIFNFLIGTMSLNSVYIDREICGMASLVVEIYGVKTLLNNFDTINMVYETNNYGFFDYTKTRAFRDYLKMVSDLGLASSFKIKFENKEDLITAHDNVVALYNLKKNTIKSEKFAKAIEDYNKFKYEDENYAIVIPATPDDIANEGNELRHCVKSYIDRVIEKTTNIVFLRKADELDKPFFTIEVDNDNTIRQIHGKCNRNLSTEPDAEYFIEDWIKHCRLKKSNYDIIR